jgi:hypothetical protein
MNGSHAIILPKPAKEVTYLHIAMAHRRLATRNRNSDLFSVTIIVIFWTFEWSLKAVRFLLGPELLWQMRSLVCELMLFDADGWEIAGHGFRFLTRVGSTKPSLMRRNLCVDWIIRKCKSITQFDSMVPSPLKRRR